METAKASRRSKVQTKSIAREGLLDAAHSLYSDTKGSAAAVNWRACRERRGVSAAEYCCGVEEGSVHESVSIVGWICRAVQTPTCRG